MKSKLAHVPEEELLAEIERRKKKKLKPPSPLTTPNLQGLMERIDNDLQTFSEKEYIPEAFVNNVFEDTLTTIYGEDIWKWYKKLQ